MKKLFLILCCMMFSYSQAQKVYKYYIYLNHSSMQPEFTKINGYAVYTGKDSDMQAFFSKYKILSFDKVSEYLKWESIQSVLKLETQNNALAKDMLAKYPSIFRKMEDATNEQPILLDPVYPNDYGNTNPNGNTGANIRRDDLDYMNMPLAWEVTTGISSGVRTKFGLSDARIKADDTDFSGRVTHVGEGTAYLQALPYSTTDGGQSRHGTAVGGIAAAKGNNNYGSVGVCYDCDIVHAAYGNYENLYRLAESGAQVINMSWVNIITPNPNAGAEWQQTIIDSIGKHYRTVLVAGAGNWSSYQTAIDYDCGYPSIGTIYCFPASYKGVISVSAVNYEYPFILPLVPNVAVSPSYNDPGSPSPLGQQIFSGVQGSVSDINGTDQYNPVGFFYNGWEDHCNWSGIKESPNGLMMTLTTNPEVDILSPTANTFKFEKYAEENQSIQYSGGGTSGCSPRVAGTVALMKTVNYCLLPDEADDILKLTSKDVEALPFNQVYAGHIGGGALDSGASVVFVNEMKKANGLAKLKNHIFNRFDFKLDKINNKLSMENIVFAHNCKADFTARNEIRLLPGTRFTPNSNGKVNLKINSSMDISCAPVVFPKTASTETQNQNTDSRIVLYPNPNNGSFDLYNVNFEEFASDNLNVMVYDLNGRKLYEHKITKEDNHHFEIQNLRTGMYILKISSETKSREIKFVRN